MCMYNISIIISDIFHFVNKYSQKFPLYKMWFGYKLYIIATDSRDIRAILNSTKCINKADLYIFAKDVLGNGLVTSEGKYDNQCYQLL